MHRADEGRWASGSQLDFSNKLKRCKAVLRFNQVSSHTLHPFFLVPQPYFQERSTDSESFWAQRRVPELGVSWALPTPLPFIVKRCREREKEVLRIHRYLVELNLHLGHFLRAWAGFCLQGIAWTGQVGTTHISPDRENITNVYSSVSRLFE